MTIAAAQDERWEAADGAPQGPEFEIRLPSRSDPERSYHIARDHDGTIWHPGCPAFRHRKRCWHVDVAHRFAEQPVYEFAKWFLGEWQKIGGAMATGPDLRPFWNRAWTMFNIARQIQFQQLGIGWYDGPSVASEHDDFGPIGSTERVAEAEAAFGIRAEER